MSVSKKKKSDEFGLKDLPEWERYHDLSQISIWAFWYVFECELTKFEKDIINRVLEDMGHYWDHRLDEIKDEESRGRRRLAWGIMKKKGWI